MPESLESCPRPQGYDRFLHGELRYIYHVSSNVLGLNVHPPHYPGTYPLSLLKHHHPLFTQTEHSGNVNWFTSTVKMLTFPMSLPFFYIIMTGWYLSKMLEYHV
jgi:hypothetical protein